MEALIPQLFIITVEASVVLLIIVLILLFFMRRNKKNDIKAVKQLVIDIKENEEFRLKSLAAILKKNDYQDKLIDKANELHSLEKSFLQELLNVYIKRDVFRLDNIPTSLVDLTDSFLKLASSKEGLAEVVSETANEETKSEPENKNNTKVLAEAAAIKEEHLKELSELRLKNTELNEHLFESLETITGLVTEHSKSQGGNDKPSAQQILDTIIYLRDQRTQPVAKKESPEKPTASKNTENEADETLFAESSTDLGLTDILKTDLESDLSADNDIPEIQQSSGANEAEEDPWADALAEQAETEKAQAEPETPATEPEADPWADALAEQAETEKAQAEPETPATEPEADPWADALAEQAETEKAQAEPEMPATEPEPEVDPWADALAEQAETEKAQAEPEVEADPWADALAEQAETEKAQAEPEMPATEPEVEADPWADALAEQAEGEKEEKSDDDLWADALAEQDQAEKK